MNPADIKVMFDYHYWANRQILEACKGLSPEQFAVQGGRSFATLRALVVHILDTECKWRMLSQYNRIENYVELVETDFATVESLEKRWAREERTMREYLAQLAKGDLDAHIQSANSAGEKWEPVRWQVLWNVVNHATEHRSEAAAILTEFGRSPGELDVAEYMNVVDESGG